MCRLNCSRDSFYLFLELKELYFHRVATWVRTILRVGTAGSKAKNSFYSRRFNEASARNPIS